MAGLRYASASWRRHYGHTGISAVVVRWDLATTQRDTHLSPGLAVGMIGTAVGNYIGLAVGAVLANLL